MLGHLSIWYCVSGCIAVFFKEDGIQSGSLDRSGACDCGGRSHVVVSGQRDGSGLQAGSQDDRYEQSGPVFCSCGRHICIDLYGFCQSNIYVLRLYGDEGVGIPESVAVQDSFKNIKNIR